MKNSKLYYIIGGSVLFIGASIGAYAWYRKNKLKSQNATTETATIELKNGDIFKTADSASFFQFKDGKKRIFASGQNSYWQNIVPVIISKEQFDTIPSGAVFSTIDTIIEQMRLLIIERDKQSGTIKESINTQLAELIAKLKALGYQYVVSGGKGIAVKINVPPAYNEPLTVAEKADYDKQIDGLLEMLKTAYVNNSNIEQTYSDVADRLPSLLDLTMNKGYEHNLSGSGGALRLPPMDDAYANVLENRIKAIVATQTGGMENEFNDYFGANYLSWDEIGSTTLLNQIKKVYIYKLLKHFGYTYSNGTATKQNDLRFIQQL